MRPEDTCDLVRECLVLLERQLSRLEKSKIRRKARRAKICAADARTLALIERTFERLLKLEQQRATLRGTRALPDTCDARAELERRLDRLLAASKDYPAPKDRR